MPTRMALETGMPITYETIGQLAHRNLRIRDRLWFRSLVNKTRPAS